MTDTPVAPRLNLRFTPEERANLNRHARRSGESITDYIRGALTLRYEREEPAAADAGLMLGYFKLDRYGDLESADSCPGCGREYGAAGIWLCVHQSGGLSGPLCSLCADSQ